MSEQRRWTIYWCERCGFREFAQSRLCPHCGHSPFKRLELVLAFDLEAAERRAEEHEKTLRMIDRRLTTVTGDNIPRGEAPKIAARELARSALSTTEEPARGT